MAGQELLGSVPSEELCTTDFGYGSTVGNEQILQSLTVESLTGFGVVHTRTQEVFINYLKRTKPSKATESSPGHSIKLRIDIITTKKIFTATSTTFQNSQIEPHTYWVSPTLPKFTNEEKRISTMSGTTWRLVTVNTAPERAKRLIGRVAENLKDRYTIEHVANAESIDKVEPTVKEYEPNVLFCASMWSPEESAKIQEIARSIVPDIKTHAIPQGLQVQRGPDAIVEYLEEQIPKLLG